MATKSKATAKRVEAAAVKGAASDVIGGPTDVAKGVRGGAAKDAVQADAKAHVTAQAAVTAKTKPLDAVTAKTNVTAKTKPRVDAVTAKTKPRVDAVTAKTKPRVDAVAKTKPRVDAVTAKAKPRVDAAKARASRVKAKIKSQLGALKATRSARSTRVKAAVAKTRKKLGRTSATRTTSVGRRTSSTKVVTGSTSVGRRTGSTKVVTGSTSIGRRTGSTKVVTGSRSIGRSGSTKVVAESTSGSKSIGRRTGSTETAASATAGSNKLAVSAAASGRRSEAGTPVVGDEAAAVAVVSLPDVKPRPTRIKAAVAAVKAKLVKGRRVASTEEREAAALAIADAHETTKPRPANENASTTPTLTTAPLATIAPRGVFLPDRVVVDVEGDTFPSTKLDGNGRDEAILSSSTFEELKRQVAEGQRLVDGDPTGAFRAFRAALELLPEPVQNWNAAGWLLVAMGECAIRTGDFAAAFAPLKDAMHCPGTIGNPWVHLRLGQCRLALGDERAADELARAYMGGGRALFEGVDPRCFALVESVLKPPPGHDRLP